MAHLHVLIDRYVPKEWLDVAWNAVGGGFTWIKYVDVHRVSAYISKYLTKALVGSLTSKKKRISTSRGIRLLQKRESAGWWYDRRSIEKHYDYVMNSRVQRISNVQEDCVGLRSFEAIERPSAHPFGDRVLTFLDGPTFETTVASAL